MPIVRISEKNLKILKEIRKSLKFEGYLKQGYAPVVTIDNALEKLISSGSAGKSYKLQEEVTISSRKKLQHSGTKIKVLELFCGTKSISRAFESRGHETRTLDKSGRFYPDYCMDIREFDISMLDGWKPGVIWASPPCTAFSPSSRGLHWEARVKSYNPKTEKAKEGLWIVEKTLQIIEELKPSYFFLENPVGVLRNVISLPDNLRKTVTYCSYGELYMKPTDIWTNCAAWIPRSRCNHKAPEHEHIKKGVQGIKNVIERARIPEELALEICLAVESRG